MAQLAKQMIAVIHERKRDEIAALEKTRLQALGSRGRKKERVRNRETREGRGSASLEGPRKSFQLAFCECGYFQLVEKIPREKVTAPGEKTVN